MRKVRDKGPTLLRTLQGLEEMKSTERKRKSGGRKVWDIVKDGRRGNEVKLSKQQTLDDETDCILNNAMAKCKI